MRQLKLWLALITGLALGLQLQAQTDPSPTQVICKGSVKPYRVDWQAPDPLTGTPGSTYDWTVAPQAPTVTPFSGSITGDGSNAVSINWGTTPAGTYTVQVVETNNGCDGDPIILAVTVKDLPTATPGGGGTVCSGSPLPDVSFVLTGEQPWSLTYSINGVPQTPVTGITSSPYVITGAAAGIYAVTAVSDVNCTGTSSGTATVTVTPAPTATVSGGGTICSGGTLPNVSIALTGSQPWSLTYAINGVPQTPVTGITTSPYVITGAAAGTYTVTAVSDAGCTGTFSGSATVIVNTLPTATVSGGGTICAGGTLPDVSFALIGSQPWSLTYAINGVPQTPVTGITTSPYVITNAAAGAYTITAISDANCTGTFSGTASVIVNPLPTATVSGGGIVCAGSTLPNVSIALTGSQPWSVTYAINGVPQAPVTGISTSPYVITGAAAGTYTVTAVSDANCTGTFSGTATVTVTPLPTITLIGSPSCSVDLLTYSVAFSVSSGTPTSSTGTPNNTGGNNWEVTGIPVASNVTISLTVSGCSKTLVVTAPNCTCPPVTAPTNPVSTSYCAGASVTSVSATVPAGFTVDWYDAASGGTRLQEGTASGVNTYTPSGPGTFYAVARDLTTGCLSSTRTPATVTQNALPTVTASADVSICTGETTQLSASGASTYTWSPATGLSTTTGTPVDANPTSDQTYTVTGTDSNGCQNTDTVTVTVKPKPVTSPIFHD
jgi:uncharacterized protein (DUF2141 family)